MTMLCGCVVALTCAPGKFLMCFISEVGPCKTGDDSTAVGIEWGSRELIAVFTVYGTVDDSISLQNAHKCSSWWGLKHWAPLVCDMYATSVVLNIDQQIHGTSMYLAELKGWVALRY